MPSLTNPLSSAFVLKPFPAASKTVLTYQHFRVEMHSDDAKDKVFLAIVKALLRQGNRPCTPKELSNLILRHKLTTLGGATPYATVSSRISQHFKRATELSRPPLLGRRSLDERNSRRLVYYVDQVGVPVKALDELAHSESDESMDVGDHLSDSFVSSLASSPVLAPGSIDILSGAHGDTGISSSLKEGAGGGAEGPATPLRVSTRVKRRRSPYSPPDDQQSKRGRSASLASTVTPIVSPSSGTGADDMDKPVILVEDVEVVDLSTPAASRRSSVVDASVPEIGANIEPDSIKNEDPTTDSEQDFHEDMMKVDGEYGPGRSYQPARSIPSTPATYRQRVSSDEFLLKPITSPQIPSFQSSLPSKLSPSRPHLGFEPADHTIPSPFFDPEVDPLGVEAHESRAEPKAENYSGLRMFDVGIHEELDYHEFHHPEDMSVSELDLLLREDEGSWGVLGGVTPGQSPRKRPAESLAPTPTRMRDSVVTQRQDAGTESVQAAKKRKVQPACEGTANDTALRNDKSGEGDDDASGHSTKRPPVTAELPASTSVSQQSASAIPENKQDSSPRQDSTEQSRSDNVEDPTPGHLNTSISNQTVSHTPSPPRTPRNDTPSDHSLPSRAHSALSVASYRSNGDTLELYEKAHDPISTRVSKIKSAPRMELVLRTLHVDSLGRAILKPPSDNEPDRKVGIRMRGYVRARELFEVAPSRDVSVPTSPEIKVEVEDGEDIDVEDESVWVAYTEEVRRRAVGPRTGDESAVVRIVGENAPSSETGHVLIVLKGSDVEGDGLVPVECGGVWIPTSEARRLATKLGVLAQYNELLDMGDESNNGEIEVLPSFSTLTSPKLPPLPSTPTRPSARSLPSPASTPIPTALSSQVPDASLGPAMLEDDMEVDEGHDFLVFEGDEEWSHDESSAVAGTEGRESNVVSNGAMEKLPVTIDHSTLELIAPVQPPANSTLPLYMATIDGVSVYITWLTKCSDGSIAATPAREVSNPLEGSSTGSEESGAATPPSAPAAPTSGPTSTPPPIPPPPGSSSAIPLLRRVDNNMVNATLLLHAGGLVTDKERSIVLSLERGRARCRKKGSGLYGTWIPLARARHLARSFCLENRLSLFLSDGFGRVVFGVDGVSGARGKAKLANDDASGSEGTPVAADGSGSSVDAGSESGDSSFVDGAGSNLSPAAAALAASKAAMLGLTSLPPNVVSGLASIGAGGGAGGIRGLMANRGRARGRPPLKHHPISGRGFMNLGRLGTTLGSSPSYTPNGTGSSVSTTPTSSAMAATQAAIAALSKLGGNGPLTAATLASALAALNQVNQQNTTAGKVTTPGSSPSTPAKPAYATGTSPSPATTAATSGSTAPAPSGIPTPASILAALANVLKSGFPGGWKPAGAPSINTPTTSTSSPLSAASHSITFPSSLKVDTKPGVSSSPLSSTSITTQGVVARALAAAGAGRGGGLSGAGLSNPVSIQTNALAGLPNLGHLGGTSFPLLPFTMQNTGNNLSLATSATSTPATISTGISIGGIDGPTPALPLLTPPTVPIIAIDDIDGGDANMPIASPAALAAAAAAAGVTLPVGVEYVEEEEVDEDEEEVEEDAGEQGEAEYENEGETAQRGGGKSRPGVNANGTTKIEHENESDESDEPDNQDNDADDDDDDDSDIEIVKSSGGKSAPSRSGGKIRPRAAVPPTPRRAPSTSGKSRGGSTSMATRSTRSTTSTPNTKSQRRPPPAPKKGRTKSKSRRGATTIINHSNKHSTVVNNGEVGSEEGSDFEIDVVDGDGVDDFR
ncbi:hypothetical protein SpCBS45565_g06336 [Spizellomyces sp. 'palustris']|nr:hypothetical protein SpCBS45565_g06336 [Spizellomyces sp. 'palustris']